MERIIRKLTLSGIICLNTIFIIAQPAYKIMETGDFSNFDGSVIAQALNDSGAVALMTIPNIDQGLTRYKGYLWREGKLTDLNLSLNRFPASVNDINNNNEICGVIADQSVQSYESAFVNKNGNEMILSPPQVEDVENNGERAYAINDSGIIAGFSYFIMLMALKRKRPVSGKTEWGKSLKSVVQ